MSRQPLPVELLVSPDARRERVTVNDHTAFRQRITPPPAPDPWDAIDELVEELRSLNYEQKGSAL